jgi:hypothetical protein
MALILVLFNMLSSCLVNVLENVVLSSSQKEIAFPGEPADIGRGRCASQLESTPNVL